jgi:signal transduction histidine kinase
MDNHFPDPGATARQHRLLTTLEGLLAIQATEARSALNQASDLVAATLSADKVDIFVNDPAVDTLVALGTSDTPMGRRQVALGLNRLALSNGGRAAEVFHRGEPYLSAHVDEDPEELRGVKYALGVRSALMAPLDVDGVRRGVLQVDSAEPERFSPDDLAFLQAVAQWIGLVLHRAELVEHITQEAAAQARRVAADELITILAHDLRGPLTPLKGHADMMRIRAQREGHQANLHSTEAMLRIMSRLQRMIDDLMDTARLEQGIFTLAPTVVDLAALARETAATLRTPSAEIEVRTPEELCVEGDATRIRQALENLLSNARQHSPDGVPVVVEVTTETRTDGAWAVLTVQDAGPGIAPDLLPRLFTRFGGGSGSKGLGLGLYLARGIAAAHGGRLTVDSTPGKGASFRLALPLAEHQPVGPCQNCLPQPWAPAWNQILPVP